MPANRFYRVCIFRRVGERGKRPIPPILGNRLTVRAARPIVRPCAQEALSAQGSIEWVVIVVCIAVALIAALIYLSNQMNIKINTVSNTLAGTNVGGATTTPGTH